MKKVVFVLLLIIALSAVLFIGSCGGKNDGEDATAAPKDVYVNETVEPASDEATTPETAETEPATESDEEETDVPEETEICIAEQTTANTEPPATQAPPAPETEPAPAVSDVFTSVNGRTYTFDELVSSGLANTLADGKRFALVPGSGGAGSYYYEIYVDYDGRTWQKLPGFYQEQNGGYTCRFALDDGSLLRFCFRGMIGGDYPVPERITFTGDGLSETRNDHFFDQLLFDDGTPLTSDICEEYSVSYNGGYGITVYLRSSEGKTLNSVLTFDPASLTVIG